MKHEGPEKEKNFDELFENPGDTAESREDGLNYDKDGSDDSQNNREVNTERLWEEIGFHKTVAGFWYNIVLIIVELAFGLIMSGIFLRYLYPFPESRGYKDLVWSLFYFFFVLFDIGTNMTMERFIAESRIKDINRMVQYVQYFIWYQMITGLLQVTGIAVYAIYSATQTGLAYLSWLMLVISTVQYPGFLNVFRNVLSALQKYDKSNLIGFIQGQFVSRLVEIGIVLYFKKWGIEHPRFGMLYAIALGSVVGTYVDDFIGMGLAAYFFNRAMADLNIKAAQCFRIDFDWELVKETFTFGLKTGIPGVLSGLFNFTITALNIAYIPQYPTWSMLSGMTFMLLWSFGRVNSGASTALYSESYLNGKKHLVTFYLAQSWKMTIQLLFFAVSLFGPVAFILPDAFRAFKIEYYMGIIPFIGPVIINYFVGGVFGQVGRVIAGANKPNLVLLFGFLTNITNVLFTYLILVVFKLPRMGLTGIIFTMFYKDIIIAIIFGSIQLYYIHKHIAPVKFPFMQSFMGSAIPSLATFAIGYLFLIIVYRPIYSRFGFLAALWPIFFLFSFSGLFIYFFFTGLFGGWDDENLGYFRDAVAMSGPSKFLVKRIYKLTEWGARISPLHNKFKIPWEKAKEEMYELNELKRSQTIDAQLF